MDSLVERAHSNSARLADLRKELDLLKAVKTRADELTAKADAIGSAIDAQTRGVHHRVQKEHQRRLQAESQDSHANIKSLISNSIEEEISRPYRDETGNRFEAVISRADEALSKDPHACLRRLGTRTYETWGWICLQTVLLVGRIYPSALSQIRAGSRTDDIISGPISDGNSSSRGTAADHQRLGRPKR